MDGQFRSETQGAQELRQPVATPGAITLLKVLDTPEFADLLKIAQVTARKWRLSGKGPPFVKVGANVRYLRSDIEAWLAARTVASTSEPCGTAPKTEGAPHE